MVDEPQRRFTTIVAADIAGFSRLIGIDEEGTLAAQRRHRNELIEPLLVEYHGCIANTAGDSFLFEFPSAVEAVRCSIAMQDGIARRNRDIAADLRIEYRIGINVGDVVSDGGDQLGDGVNIAARLENLCAPGSIILSDDAYRQVRDRLDVSWEDGGEHEVKNIARPVAVWRWSLAVSSTVASTAADTPLPTHRCRCPRALLSNHRPWARLWRTRHLPEGGYFHPRAQIPNRRRTAPTYARRRWCWEAMPNFKHIAKLEFDNSLCCPRQRDTM